MEQNWTKLGLIFDFASVSSDYSYATVPTVLQISEDVIRVIFSTRNRTNQSIPVFIDYHLLERKIVGLPQLIKLDLGSLGTFDDSGIMPSCLIKNGKDLWMYYIGWNLGVTVPFRNSVGLAISQDNGANFTKRFEGPILDRTKEEPHFTASNCVVFDDNIYKMWYLSCIKWEAIGEELKHFYHIKYAVSYDGIDWRRSGTVAIDFRYENEYAISVPRVIIEGEIYKMWYSYRGGTRSEKYRVGYAESCDGIEWTRKDELIDLDVSETGWDSEMICYPFVFDHKGRRYMLYNGNGYGKTGFGLAVLEK